MPKFIYKILLVSLLDLNLYKHNNLSVKRINFFIVIVHTFYVFILFEVFGLVNYIQEDKAK